MSLLLSTEPLHINKQKKVSLLYGAINYKHKKDVKLTQQKGFRRYPLSVVKSSKDKCGGAISDAKNELLKPNKTKISTKDVFKLTWDLIFNCDRLPELLLAYALKDLACFLINRISHYLTNAAAKQVLGVEVFNPWWLYMDPAFLQSTPGYLLLVGVFFVVALPLTSLVDSAAFAVSAGIIDRRLAERRATSPSTSTPEGASPQTPQPDQVLSASSGELRHVAGQDQVPSTTSVSDAIPLTSDKVGPATAPGHANQADQSSASSAGAQQVLGGEGKRPLPSPPSKPSFWQRLWQAIVAVALALKSDAAPVLKPLWQTDLALNWHALPYQALALAVLPLPWALPRLLELQLAGTAVVRERQSIPSGESAWSYGSKRSKALLAGQVWRYALPFLVLRAAVHLMDLLHGQLLALVPKRWWSDVVEIPLAATVLLMLLRSIAGRLLNVLPLATHQLLLAKEQEKTAVSA